MKNTFGYRPEARLNPYIGFTSFEHFEGERLYSDIIVDPSKNMTETENLECYPVPENVPQNGRNEGYYPATTVAYIRILWKEFEPRQGEYNYEGIERILNEADVHGQTVMFRLMAHSTRASDDVPDWVKCIVDCPARPEGKRVKDSPTDPEFFRLFGDAVKKIAERFDGDCRLHAVDISLPGAWGEGHQLELFNEELQKRLMDVYIDSFKQTFLIAQVASPAMINYVNSRCHVGWRADGFGNPYQIYTMYPELTAQFPDDLWKYAPVSSESFWWLGEWKRKGWDVDEIFGLLLSYHISTFNAKSLPAPTEWRQKIDEFVEKMGYHFMIDAFSCCQSARKGSMLNAELTVTNRGVAPIYTNLPLKIRLKNSNNETVIPTGIDIRIWLPGQTENAVCVALPDNLVAGVYSVQVGIVSDDEKRAVLFCTDAPRDGNYFTVGKITVS